MAVSDAQSGGDTFWPGYVDAISNLVLNLLFVVAILTIAVFIFALQLGRQQAMKSQAAAQAGPAASSPEDVRRLEDELRRLRRVLAARAEAGERAAAADSAPGPHKEVRVRAPETPPSAPALKDTASHPGGIVIVFDPAAVGLEGEDAERARRLLAPVMTAGHARLTVVARRGFSEARRTAFYRAMAVRNLLIDGGLRPDAIDVSIVERDDARADGTRVQVQFP